MPLAGLRFLCCVSHDIESATTHPPPRMGKTGNHAYVYPTGRLENRGAPRYSLRAQFPLFCTGDVGYVCMERLVWIPRNRSKITSNVYRSGLLPAAPPHGCPCPCHGRKCYLWGVGTDCMIMSLQAAKGRMMPAAGLRFLCCVSHDIESAILRATIPRETGGHQPKLENAILIRP